MHHCDSTCGKILSRFDSSSDTFWESSQVLEPKTPCLPFKSPASWNHLPTPTTSADVHDIFQGSTEVTGGKKASKDTSTKESQDSDSSQASFTSHWSRVSSLNQGSDVHGTSQTWVTKTWHFRKWSPCLVIQVPTPVKEHVAICDICKAHCAAGMWVLAMQRAHKIGL